jgi:hypothetical protein
VYVARNGCQGSVPGGRSFEFRFCIHGSLPGEGGSRSGNAAELVCCRQLPERKRSPERKEARRMKEVPKYESPRIVTYSEADILKELGPAQACTSPCPVP